MNDRADGTLRIYYDGVCPLCRGAVRLALRWETPPGALRFAPIGGATFCERLDDAQRSDLPDSLIAETPDGRLLVRSDAVVEVLGRLGRPGRAAAAALHRVPRPIRDGAYRLVARVRRPFRWDPTRCPALPARWASRIDP
jgi:predicted DCC family thiol-disulfide oxidoreductase YuxK